MDIPLSIEQFDEEKWRATQTEWRKKIENVEVPYDIEGQLIIQVEYMLDQLYTEASWYYTRYRTLYENLNDLIEVLRKAYGDEGKNPEQRKSNAYKMLLYYPSGREDDEKSKNLIELKSKLRDRYYFFKDFVMDNLRTKKDRLNTDIGASKIHAQIETSYGAGA